VLLVAGCAHAEGAADRHFAEMQNAMGKDQAEQDRANQSVGLLDGEDAPEARAETAQAPKAAKPAPAAVRTVQIGDSDNRGESDDPNDPNARPEIRLQGQPGAAASRPVRGKTSRNRAGNPNDREQMRVEPSDESLQSDAPRPSSLDPEAKRSYDNALSLVHDKKYDRALEALSAFLVRWPDHPYVENALYWRGESYFARGEFLRAAEQFEAVLARPGAGAKSADALLKIGMCHSRLGAPDRAKEYWDRLRRDFPRSDAAKRIPGSSEDSKGRGAGPKENR
jgi:tol-pal system protein YbgF